MSGQTFMSGFWSGHCKFLYGYPNYSRQRQKVHRRHIRWAYSVNAMVTHRIAPIFSPPIYALLKQFIRLCSRMPRPIYLHYDAMFYVFFSPSVCPSLSILFCRGFSTFRYVVYFVHCEVVNSMRCLIYDLGHS